MNTWLTSKDLLPFRGAFVKIDGEEPHAWRDHDCPERMNIMGLRPGYSDFKPKTWTGLLGRKVKDTTENVTWFSIDRVRERGRLQHIEELWRPAKTAVRYVCNVCGKSDPVGIALADRYESYSITTKPCSLCKKTPKYDRITNRGLRGVFETPIEVWRYEDREQLLEFLRDVEFRRVLRAHNDAFYIHQARLAYQKIEGHSGRVWEIWLRSKAGSSVSALTPDAPTVVDWESWFDLPAMRERFTSGRSNDGLLSWGCEVHP